MLRTVLNKLLMVLYFVLGAVVLEAVTFSVLGLGFMPEYFLLNLSIICFIAILIFAIPNYTAQYVVYTVILFIQTVFIYVNYSLFNIYGDFFSFEMLRLVGEAGAAITTDFLYFSIILQLVAVFLAIAIIGSLLLKVCKKNAIQLKQHFSVFNVIILIVLNCFSCGYFFNTRLKVENYSTVGDSQYVYSDTFLMHSTLLKFSSYQKFGTYGYFTNLIFNQFEKINNQLKADTIEYFDNGLIYGEDVTSDVFGIDEGNNIIVIMMETLEWYPFGNGIYDKNVNNLSAELTPNVYNLIYGDTSKDEDNSFISKNFFAKAKTNISEGLGVMGHYPVGEGLTTIVGNKYDSSTNAFGYTMPNVMKKLGYTTTYLHSNEITFYDRNKTHYALGFDNVIGKDGILRNGEPVYTGDDLKFNNWAPEGELVSHAIDYIIPTNYQEKPFYSFFLNVSSHGPFNYYEKDGDCMRFKDYVRYGKENCDEVGGKYIVKEGRNNSNYYTTFWANVLKEYQAVDPSLCDEILYWQCGVCGLDEAIGIIIKKLQDCGIYDKTTMLLYSDHYSYYDKLANRFKGFPLHDFSSVELNTIPFILSSPGIKSHNLTQSNKIEFKDRFCSAYDIIPTLFDLLGIKFNENLYVGSSLFKELDAKYEINDELRDMVIYYSNTGGIFSKDIYTYNLQDFEKENIAIDNEDLDLFKKEVAKVLTKLNYISLLDNYKIFNNLTKV